MDGGTVDSTVTDNPALPYNTIDNPFYMKRIIPFAFLAAVVLAGCRFNFSGPPSQNNPATSSTPSTTPVSTLQIYKNGTYGFEFKYSPDMVFVTPVYASLQDKIVELSIPHDSYPKTNFGDAAFSVSASYSKSLAACLSQNPPENGDGFKTKTEINGQPFYMTSSTGAGAGNRYDATFYRTLIGTQTCVELGETIHTSNIGNYDPGTVTEVDKKVVQAKLDKILSSFTFKP